MGLFSRRKNNQKQEAPAAQQNTGRRPEPTGTAEEKVTLSILTGGSNPALLEDILTLSRAQNSWRGFFFSWLARYIGWGVPADQVNIREVGEYLKENAYYQQACELAPMPYNMLLKFAFPMQLASGINWKYGYGYTPEHNKMVGLFHAVTQTFLNAGNTVFADNVKGEATFWAYIFQSYPGADRNDSDWKLMLVYLMAYNQDDARMAVEDETAAALQEGREELSGDGIRLYILARDEMRNGPIRLPENSLHPSGNRVPLLMKGAAAGDAGCVYQCVTDLMNELLRQKWYDVYGPQIGEAENEVKGFLDKLAEKLDANAKSMRGLLDDNTARCQSEKENG